MALSRRVLNAFANVRRIYAFGFRRVPVHQAPPIVKLQPAKTAMVQTSTAEPLYQVQETMRHLVDLVPFPELRQTVRAASRAPAFGSQVKLISVRKTLPRPAFPAFIYGKVAQSLPEIPVDAFESRSPAFAALGHVVIYTPNAFYSSSLGTYNLDCMRTASQ